MKFYDTRTLLIWYFNKDWLKFPKSPGNHSPFYSGNHLRNLNMKDVVDTFIRITNILKSLPKKDLKVIGLFHTRKTEVKDIARRLHISERRIYQIKKNVVQSLAPIFNKEGLFFKSRYEEPIFVKEETNLTVKDQN